MGLPPIEGGAGDMEASIATKWKVGEKGVKKGKKKDEELLRRMRQVLRKPKKLWLMRRKSFKMSWI